MNLERVRPQRAEERARQIMTVGDLLAPGHVVLDLRVADKRRLLDELAGRAAETAGIPAAVIAEALNSREQLGSTGMGAGIAIPHARLAHVTEPIGFFARLRTPMDFDAIDGQKVDLVFLLLLPAQAQGDHLNALACVARRLRSEETKVSLRKCHDPARAHALLTASERG